MHLSTVNEVLAYYVEWHNAPQDWLEDLGTIFRNRIQPRLPSLPAFQMTTRPTPSQQYALDLLRARL